MIRNIIFDIGNVLSDFCWKEFLLNQGFSEEMAMRIGRASTLHPYWNEIDRGVWTMDQLIDAFVSNDPEIEEQIRSAFADTHGIVTPRDYAIPWIQELKARGYRVYYLSNFSRKAEEECADALAFIPYTDGGILSHREKIIKPDPAIYRLLMSRYGLVAQECVFLDDTLKNVKGAEAVGMHGILFQSREQAEEEIEKLSARHG